MASCERERTFLGFWISFSMQDNFYKISIDDNAPNNAYSDDEISRIFKRVISCMLEVTKIHFVRDCRVAISRGRSSNPIILIDAELAGSALPLSNTPPSTLHRVD